MPAILQNFPTSTTLFAYPFLVDVMRVMAHVNDLVQMIGAIICAFMHTKTPPSHQYQYLSCYECRSFWFVTTIDMTLFIDRQSAALIKRGALFNMNLTRMPSTWHHMGRHVSMSGKALVGKIDTYTRDSTYFLAQIYVCILFRVLYTITSLLQKAITVISST